MPLPTPPNAHAVAAMALTIVALYLFSRKRYPLELTSLGLIVILTVGFSLFPFADGARSLEPVDLFFGFGHEALIAVCALMVMGQGLVLTGALEPVGRTLAKAWGRMPFLSLLATLVIGAVLSAFVNNTPIVVLLLPILVSVCLRTGSSPSKILMPMGLSTLVGGTATTIGTSTNLLVVAVAADLGMRRFEMFDFALPAVIAAGVAIAYLWLIAPRLLPDRSIALSDVSPRLFEGRLQINQDSPAVDGTLSDAISLAGGSMRVSRIRRGDTYILPLPDVVLREGDRLRVRDTPTNLKSFEESLKATLYGDDRTAGDQHAIDDEHPLRDEDQVVAEVAVVQGSTLDRANLRYARFIGRFQLAVLALHRPGQEIMRADQEIQDVTLAPGDILLVQGPRDQIRELKRDSEFLVLDSSMTLPRTRKAPLAFGLVVMTVAAAALGIMPIAVSATAGAALMLGFRCMSIGAAIRAISPSVFFVVAASLALGAALVETGATGYLTEVFLALTHGTSPTVTLGSLMLLLAILTNVVSNNAAAVIGTPIALGIAQGLALPPEPFVLAVLFGANLSYATPMAYKTNLLVMSTGNYTFSDFLRVGVPLTIIMWLVLTFVLSSMYF
jgi:di/tricarboxylate transporter